MIIYADALTPEYREWQRQQDRAREIERETLEAAILDAEYALAEAKAKLAEWESENPVN